MTSGRNYIGKYPLPSQEPTWQVTEEVQHMAPTKPKGVQRGVVLLWAAFLLGMCMGIAISIICAVVYMVLTHG